MVLTPDPLAQWFVHKTLVARMTGDSGGYGRQLADPVPVFGFVHDGTKIVRNANGDEVVSTTQIAYPAGIAPIPGDSMITLPDVFGGRTARVISVAVADAGPLPTPNHIEIALE